jgi:predicted component of type VI protein secretion system
MKVQLVVVRGKPEGKVIPLVGPNFKIGRGETCHLRPNSEQVSREHAEFTIADDSVSVRDLGSRNGTLVNGKALVAESCRLKDRDLVQVGPLTFAVAILDAPSVKAPAPSAKGSPDDVSTDEIDSWLIGPNSAAAAEQPTAVYGGDTITINAFKDASSAAAKPASNPPSASDDEYERQPDDEDESIDDQLGEEDDELVVEDESGIDEEEEEDEEERTPQEEFIDESNPFYAAKKAQKDAAKQTTGPKKPAFQDTSDAANDILRRLMEKRRADRG